jgi:hypothetical protein
LNGGRHHYAVTRKSQKELQNNQGKKMKMKKTKEKDNRKIKRGELQYFPFLVSISSPMFSPSASCMEE